MAGEVGTMEDWLKEAADTKDTCRPFFYRRSIKDNFRSEKEGRAIFYDVDFVRIEIPGESKLRPDRPVQEEDKKRWPKSWDAYVKGLEQPVIGTPITEWAFLTPGQVETFKAVGIRTIEDVAGLPDSSVAHLGPNGFKVREAAQRHLKPADDAVRTLQAQMAEMARKNQELEARLAQVGHQPAPAPIPAPPVEARAKPQAIPVPPARRSKAA